jgi:hypothetical protein
MPARSRATAQSGRSVGGRGEDMAPCLFFVPDWSVVCVLRMAGLRKCHLTKSVNLPYLYPTEAIDLKGKTMIQDRLTAKFLAAQPAKRDKENPRRAIAPKVKKAPVTDLYTRGRSLIGSFWL